MPTTREDLFLNAPTFASATAIFTDEDMNICAPDGLYSDGLITRQLTNCLLGPPQACAQCIPPCGTLGTVNQNANGVFLAELNLGTTLGAVTAYFRLGASIPDGVDIIHAGTHYNYHFTFAGNVGGPVGLNAVAGLPTYIGSGNTAVPPTTNPLPVETFNVDAQGNGVYSPNGQSQIINTVPQQVDTRGNETYMAVFPRTDAAASTATINIFCPIQQTFFEWELYCPGENYRAFQGSPTQGDISCNPADTTYYFAANSLGNTIAPHLLSYPIVGDLVFSDALGVSLVNPVSTTSVFIIADNNQAIEIAQGIVISVAACDPT